MCPVVNIPEDEKIRCAVVHDHVLLRQGLRRLLEDEPDMWIVAEAGSAADALKTIAEQHPDVVIAGAHLFDCPIREIERLILREAPGTRILWLTAQDVEGLEQGGEKGCAMRQTSAEELVEMVRGAASRTKTNRRYGTAWAAEGFPSRNRTLTARELEVLKLLAEGRTVRSTAGILGLSAKTVDAHKFNLMRKLGIHNKAELVMWAIQQKVLKVPVNF